MINISISIIIPVYNTPKNLLQRCINSLTKQTYPYAELIIINDGSQQEFKNYIHMIGENTPRCKIIDTENQGVSSARNTGIKNCSSEYIMFVDADDTVAPFMLKEAAEIAEKTQADIIYGRIADVNNIAEFTVPKDKEKLVFEFIDTNEKKIHLLNNLIVMTDKEYWTKGARMNVGPIAKLVKHSLAKDILFNRELKIGEDRLWNLQVAKKAQRIVMVKSCWYYYFVYKNSATHRFWAEGLEDFIRWHEYLHKEMAEEEFMISLKKMDIDIMMQVMRSYYAHKEYPYSCSKANRDFIQYKKESNLLNFDFKTIKKLGLKYIIKLALLKYNKWPVTGYKIVKMFKRIK